jgi:outer membrane protein assembly factor BamA
VNYDRSLGFSVGAVPMLMFNPTEKDTISPSSLIGGVGFWTTNKTWFLMGFGVFYLSEDRWRVTTAGGGGTVNFQFYLDSPINSWIPYQSEADFFMLKVERRIYKKLYGGVSYVYADVLTSSETLPFTDSLTIHGIGLSLSMDRRSNPYYPRSGYYTTVKYNGNPHFMGNEDRSQKIKIDHNHYFPVRRNTDVVAARFHAGMGIGDISFNQQFIVMNTDIRGYTQGAYRGNYLLALQGEYRWNFLKRWGAVGFAGVATVFEAINESDNGKLLPGIGTGIRFRAFTETNFSVGIDVAAGLEDWGIYFQIGEAF